MGVVAFIPLRGGSKSIPGKNIRPLLGRPLCDWVIRSCLDAGIFQRVVVATDDPKIEAVAIESGAEIYQRSHESASDTAPTSMVIDEYLALNPEIETLYLIQATSPLTTPKELQDSYQKFKENNASGLVTCTRQHHFRWSENGQSLNYDPASRPRRQDWDGELYEDGSFYVLNVQEYLKTHQIPTGKSVVVFELKRSRHIEIDDPIDFIILEHLLQNGDIVGHQPEQQ